MTDTDFNQVTDLAHVRALKSLIEDLDPSVGETIKDDEHSLVRRTVRAWEQRLMERIGTPRRARSDKQLPLGQ